MDAMQPSLDMVGLVVADMATSLAFYRRLGVPFPADADAERHVEATLPNGLRLALDRIDVIRSFEPDWAPPAGSARMALAFLCDSPAEVDSTFAALVAAGADGARPPWDAPWGQRYARLRDPDGNDVDLFAPS